MNTEVIKCCQWMTIIQNNVAIYNDYIKEGEKVEGGDYLQLIEFANSYLKTIINDYRNNTSEINWNDLISAPVEQLQLIGFLKLSETSRILLIPRYLAGCIPIDTILFDVSGREIKFNNNTSKDTRFGVLNYGIIK